MAMNDEDIIIQPKSPAAPSASNDAPNDTEEQDTVSDRVFDFSDGDIKPVKDVDGPVTHSVNLKIAEALRNPRATISPTPAAQPSTPKNPASIAQSSISTKPSPAITPPSGSTSPKPTGAWQPISAQPINKLETQTPQKPIPHPKIDPSMQAPSVRVYSQIPHAQAPNPPKPIVANPPVPVTPTTPPAPVVTKTAPTSAPIKPMSPMNTTPAVPPARPVVDAPLQEILKRAYTRAQNNSALPEGEFLDKKIGTFDSSPFAAPAKANPPSFTESKPLRVTVPTTSTPRVETKPGPKTMYREPIEPVADRAQNTTPRPQYQPANPPSKTIGQKLSDYTASPDSFKSNTPKSLQEEVGAVLPKDTGPKILQSEQPASTSTKAPEQKNLPEQDGSIKSMRTYEGDVAEIMSHRRTSTASIAIAENKKESGESRLGNTESPQPSSHALVKTFMAIMSVLLIGGGAYTGYYFYLKSPLAPADAVAPQQKQSNSIIATDSEALIPIDGQIPVTILSRIETEMAKPQTPGTIKEIIFTMHSKNGTLMRVGAPDMAKIMDISAPDTIMRTIIPEWMVGVYADPQGESSAFVIVTTNFFQNAFSGMLQWEQVMPDDLKQYLSHATIGANSILSVTDASTTNATSSAPTSPSPYVAIRGTFQDRIIRNKDVRSFKTPTGQTLFLYSFIDDSHLIIARNEMLLAEVLLRLEKKAFIR